MGNTSKKMAQQKKQGLNYFQMIVLYSGASVHSYHSSHEHFA